MNSVGQAWAVLRGRLSGDKKEAKKFLEGLSPNEFKMRNRTETRGRSFRRKFKMGSRY